VTSDAIRVRRARVAIYGPVATGVFGVLLLVSGAIGFTRIQFDDATTHVDTQPTPASPGDNGSGNAGGLPGQSSISAPTQGRFLLVGADARLYAIGDLAHPRAATPGSTAAGAAGGRIIGAAVAATGGTWLARADGHVFASDAPDLGGVTLRPGAARIVAIASSADGRGYRLVAADGHVYSVGAPDRGSDAPSKNTAPVVGIATSTKDGYWIARADGSVSSFGAPTLGHLRLPPAASSVVAISATLDGAGYWLATADGHVHGYGAPFRGDLGTRHITARIVAIAASAMDGYWLTTADGQVHAFGAPTFATSEAGKPRAPIIAILPY